MLFFLTLTHDVCTDIPTKSEYQSEVTPFIGNLTTDGMVEHLTKLTSFRNRYYKSSYGAQSCRWLIKQIQGIAEGTDHVSVKEFKHKVKKRYTQYCNTK